MSRTATWVMLILGLVACDQRSVDIPVDQAAPPELATSDEKYNTITLRFNNPTVLDNSDWVLYPLAIEELEETDKGYSKVSRSGGRYGYWNVALHNTETREARLLSDELKMLVNSIHPHKIVTVSSEPKGRSEERLIFYSITKADYNQDRKLNSVDPKYLFVSDPSGQGFQQISPDNFDVAHWELTDRANKVLIQAYHDSNEDKRFTPEDETVSFVYDLEEQKLEPVFGDDFNLKTKKLFESQWTKKK